MTSYMLAETKQGRMIPNCLQLFVGSVYWRRNEMLVLPSFYEVFVSSCRIFLFVDELLQQQPLLLKNRFLVSGMRLPFGRNGYNRETMEPKVEDAWWLPCSNELVFFPPFRFPRAT